MQIPLESASCVLAGALNRAILRPEWLVQQDLLPAGQEIAMEVMITPGPMFHRFSAEGLTWRSEPGKLTIERTDQTIDADPGKKVAGVLRVLEHTPVVAVGNNFHFAPAEGARKKLRELVRNPLSDRLVNLYPDGHITLLMFEGPCEDARLQITFEREGTRDIVRLNFHRDTATTDVAQLAAQQWSSDLRAAESFAVHLRGMLS